MMPTPSPSGLEGTFSARNEPAAKWIMEKEHGSSWLSVYMFSHVFQTLNHRFTISKFTRGGPQTSITFGSAYRTTAMPRSWSWHHP